MSDGGCWLSITASDGTEVMVRFKDHSFVVPKEILNEQVCIQGVAYKEATSVEDLRAYAASEGATKEAIEAIVEAEISYAIYANAVEILK